MADVTLTDRALEIAVAQALGWTLDPPPTDSGQAPYFHTPDGRMEPGRFLTDPSAFARVLAALDASGRCWHFGKRRDYWAAIAIDPSKDWPRATGTTYQEAMCRAFVAYKRATT